MISNTLQIHAAVKQTCMDIGQFHAEVLFRHLCQIDRNGFFQVVNDRFMFLNILDLFGIILIDTAESPFGIAQGKASHTAHFFSCKA